MFQVQLPITPLKQPIRKVRVLNITESDSSPEMNITATVIHLTETIDGSAPVLDTSNFTIDWTATESEIAITLAKLNNMAAKYLSLTREIWYCEMEIKQFN